MHSPHGSQTTFAIEKKIQRARLIKPLSKALQDKMKVTQKKSSFYLQLNISDFKLLKG